MILCSQQFCDCTIATFIIIILEYFFLFTILYDLDGSGGFEFLLNYNILTDFSLINSLIATNSMYFFVEFLSDLTEQFELLRLVNRKS